MMAPMAEHGSNDAAASQARRGRPPSGAREQILATTYELLREKGIARLKTKEIAARSGVSEGSVFYHFRSREGLLSAAFEQAIAPLIALTGQSVGDRGLRETLTDFTAAVEQFLEHAVVVMFAAQSDIDLRVGLAQYLSGDVNRRPERGVRLVGEYLAGLQESGAIRPGVDVETAAFMLVSSCLFRVSYPWLIGGPTAVPAREEVVDTLIALLES